MKDTDLMTRDKGQGTRDKGQGTITINRKPERIPTFEVFQKRWLKEMESHSKKLAKNPATFAIEMKHYPLTFFRTYNIRGNNRTDLMKASRDFVVGMKQLSEANVLQRNKKLWNKIEMAEATMKRVAEHESIPMNGKGMAGFIGFLFLMLNQFPDTFSNLYRRNSFTS